jgi:2-(1,2-epoxy-1,2-dihydrophenyl)acetyl-CoA isomerase
MSQEILTEITGPVATITFNRPEARNAVYHEMLEIMREFLVRIEEDPGIRCIVLTGAGEHFMAGGDVMAFHGLLQQPGPERREHLTARVASNSPLFLQMARMPQPMVARIRGAVAGAALGFVGGCDFAVCEEKSIFVLAHVRIGASPDGSSSYYLPRLVGVRKAKELAFFGDRVTAREALDLGLVSHVVPVDQLDAKVSELVARIVAAPAESVRRAKLLMDRSLHNTLAEQLALEAECFGACAATDNFTEGVSAFVEKRAAVFNKTS